MNLRSMMALPVQIALTPARIAVHVLLVMENRWMSNPTLPPVDLSPGIVNAGEQCQWCAWYD